MKYYLTNTSVYTSIYHIDFEGDIMTTGSFRNCGNMKGAVAISNGAPDFFRGPRYKLVAPRWDMLRMPREEYDREFDFILARLDPEEVYRDLVALGGEDAILLCWEKPNTWCHRRRIAEWLENSLTGVVISEYGFERSQVYPYYGPPPQQEEIKKQLELF